MGILALLVLIILLATWSPEMSPTLLEVETKKDRPI